MLEQPWSSSLHLRMGAPERVMGPRRVVTKLLLLPLSKRPSGRHSALRGASQVQPQHLGPPAAPTEGGSGGGRFQEPPRPLWQLQPGPQVPLQQAHPLLLLQR